MSDTTFLPGVQAPAHYDDAYWFVYDGFKLFVIETDDRNGIPRMHAPEDAGFDVLRRQFVGWYGEVACFSAEVSSQSTNLTGTFSSLRRLYGKLPETLFWIAGRAVQLVDWDRTHLYCGRCGSEMGVSPKEHVKICPECDLRNYPRISPAVIVAVTRDDKLLLAHNRRHPPELYTVLAGFVEAGETLEDTVRREIKEEVGIDVDNIRYFASQPWAFPNSLMLGFTADWAGGEFVFEDDDIEDAKWFSAEELPTYPRGPSIANALIVDWIAKHKKGSA